MTNPDEKPQPLTVTEIYEAALRLSVAEREKLMELLEHEKSDDWASADIRQAWIDESQRRMRLLKSGETETVSSDDALSRARQRIASLRR